MNNSTSGAHQKAFMWELTDTDEGTISSSPVSSIHSGYNAMARGSTVNARSSSNQISSMSTSAFGTRNEREEYICHSRAVNGHFANQPRCPRLFLSDPMHASALQSGGVEKEVYSKVPLAEAKCCENSEAATSPVSGDETNAELEAGNPLLRRAEGKSELDGVEGEMKRCGIQRGVSSADKCTDAGGEEQRGGEDSRSPPDAQSARTDETEAATPSRGASTMQGDDRTTQTRLDELSLLSFNAGLLEYKLCGLRVYQNPPFTQRRLHHIPAAILSTGADIICLQEVYGENHADFIIESTRHKLPFVGRRTSGGRFALHNGLMVLSKFPIVHTQFHKFEDVTYIERCFASKGMLEVAIDVPSIGVIAVFNIHLASGAVDPESRYVEDVRAAEIRQLLKACDAAADRGHVPLVIGDLNAAPHLCASNYKCFVERGWRDCWLHVHGHQRHLLQHHLLHQQQLLDEQQLDDQGIELHDRHIRRDLFVRVRRQRRMRMHIEPGPRGLQAHPAALSQVTASSRSTVQQHVLNKSDAAPSASVTSDADISDTEGEQKQQLLGQRQSLQARSSQRSGPREQSVLRSSGTGQRDRSIFFGNMNSYPSNENCRRGPTGGSSRRFPHQECVELSNCDSSDAATTAPRNTSGRNSSALSASAGEEESASLPVRGLLGGYFGRAGGGVQLPLAFELPAAAAWAHREFFLTAKRRLIEQQQKWLGGGDKAPVLDVRLSLSAPQHQQRGVDATPLASDCSLASCSTALTAVQGGDKSLMPGKAWRSVALAVAPAQSHWNSEGTDGSVADWLLSDTDEETESGESGDTVIQCASDEDRANYSRRDFTWDPENPLNSIGPHAGCHGLRCDYVFLPPHQFAGGLYPFLPVAADILMRDPRVLVDACCFGCFGEVMLVTLSDHYAIRITLRRSTDTDIADFWGSCAAEAAALRSVNQAERDPPAASCEASLQASE
ncbi:endonuclease/exonuclease/phosphatase domain-containing protein, putative [Eimeria tenella]|uniref:Endonuclease/exonuclease/phosphatase domain-containing protein, putative n=1 Tax=Eimeria tenella TaxID=5802 RepID=U6L4H3_EIMTE|nr:endonuclease/exonuclease/phosphatase domain-containing protein, putative [Eimeria tenella]CDJ42675.1 endonuclease/exonuclease/phosphatase domain-containing protein, putative [Eimeria tenella]|eukprot:XP_013233425.1 endonuclease/exonuclease/phosphatase domain-containing protein, putative [Eimeria tenella]